MYQLLLGLYILVCFLLVVVILMQSGRGGGLVESFSAAETIFGGKTNIYLVRITMVLGALFLILALGLNYFVVQRSKSVMERLFKKRAISHTPMRVLPKKTLPINRSVPVQSQNIAVSPSSLKKEDTKANIQGTSQDKQKVKGSAETTNAALNKPAGDLRK